MRKLTPLMMKAERQLGGPLEQELPRKISEAGISGAAEELGVSKTTVNYWILKFGIQIQKVAVSAGEEIIIKRAV